jgi:hypothetical protein
MTEPFIGGILVGLGVGFVLGTWREQKFWLKHKDADLKKLVRQCDIQAAQIESQKNTIRFYVEKDMRKAFHVVGGERA